MIRVPLKRRDGSVEWALLDDEDRELAGYHWVFQHGYASRREAMGRRGVYGPRLYMHREVMGATDPKIEIDHIDGNKLNNRRANLRLVAPAQQMQNRRGLNSNNTSGARGVSRDRARGKWVAHARLDYRQIHLGRFDSKQEAADAAATFRAQHMAYSGDARAA